MTPRPPKRKCPGCAGRHAVHSGPCKALGPSKCVPIFAEAGTGFMCGARPPCPCGWRDCACGQPVVITVELPPGVNTCPPCEVILVPCERVPPGDAGDGLLAVRKLADGFLACRGLAEGEEPGEGEWRAREHDDERPGHRIAYTKRERATAAAEAAGLSTACG
jgi:hypothetical protein